MHAYTHAPRNSKFKQPFRALIHLCILICHKHEQQHSYWNDNHLTSYYKDSVPLSKSIHFGGRENRSRLILLIQPVQVTTVATS